MLPLAHQCADCKASFYTETLLDMHMSAFHKEIPIITSLDTQQHTTETIPTSGYGLPKLQHKKFVEIEFTSEDEERLEKKFNSLKVVKKLHKTEINQFRPAVGIKANNDVESENLEVIEDLSAEEDGETLDGISSSFMWDSLRGEDDVRFVVVNDDGIYVTENQNCTDYKTEAEETVQSADDHDEQGMEESENSESESLNDQREMTISKLIKNPGLIEMRRIRHKKIDGRRVMNVTSVLEFKCKRCDQVFPTKHERRLHLETHARDLRFFCNECGRGFRKNQGLLLHLNVHTVGKRHQCPHCRNFYRTSRYLKEHIKLHIPEEYKFQCNICSKSFAHHTAFKYHMRAHAGETPFVCNICGKGYRQKPSLEAHVNLHEGTRPYKCPVCEKGFRMKHTLRDHQRLHTDERPHVCNQPECGKAFRTSTELYKHKMVHKVNARKVVCTADGCQKSFFTSAQMKRHRLTHKDGCGKSYILRNQLKTHMMKHNGVKTHACTYRNCDKRFFFASHLSRHLQTSHRSRHALMLAGYCNTGIVLE